MFQLIFELRTLTKQNISPNKNLIFVITKTGTIIRVECFASDGRLPASALAFLGQEDFDGFKKYDNEGHGVGTI